jgi:site-specific DNA-methyltransferase (adenine-specific)
MLTGESSVRSPDLYLGDCLFWLAMLPDNSVDAVVTDPPYGLSFMGKKWDYDVPGEAIWRECLRVLKPGGHLLAFAGTRTQHRMAVRIEDAGFEIRDMIAWVYGSGFPKSLDVSKAIDKAAGAEREVVGTGKRSQNQSEGWDRPWKKEQMAEIGGSGMAEFDITAPATDAARQWQGWGTALKPALEPITVARKPLIGTVAENVLAHGTGGLNVDGCRVGTDGGCAHIEGTGGFDAGTVNAFGGHLNSSRSPAIPGLGRWPANLIHDGSDEVVGLFPQAKGQQGAVTGAEPSSKTANAFGEFAGRAPSEPRGDSGSAARFFYCAKASKRDRDEGCEGLPVKRCSDGRASGLSSGMPEKALAAARNHHPTVKPTDLMRYLCRLVTPPGGVVLDPFMGSGSTGKAAALEGFHFIGMERDADYFTIAQARIDHARKAD